MAPGYRNTTRRAGRGAVDHDVFEGLPVRQWRPAIVYVASPPTQDGLDNVQDKWDVELPWGMPKDSHLLPQHAQDLLRAARSGRIYKRSLPIEEEADDVDGILGEKPDKKEEIHKDRGFAAKAWKQTPRHLEGPDIDYLAKRRKGLQAPNQPIPASTPAMTRITVRRTDAAGNVYQEVIVVPQGQVVDGEIVKQTPLVDPSVAASQAAAAAQPARILSRKPPLPKGKRKGPGRGRKKKILAPTSVPGPSPAQLPASDTAGPQQTQTAVSSLEGLKTNLKTENSANEDTEMGEDSQHASDDDGDDGEEGEEGEIIESDDDQDGSADGETSTPTPTIENNNLGSRGGKSVPSAPPTAMKSVSSAHTTVVIEDIDATHSPDAISMIKTTSLLGKEGSPLKAVETVEEDTGQSQEVEETVPAEITEEPNLMVSSAQLEIIPEVTPLITQPVSPTVSAIPEQILEISVPTASSLREDSLPKQEPEVEEELDEMLLDTIESEGLHQLVVENLPEILPEILSGTLPETLSETVPETLFETLPENPPVLADADGEAASVEAEAAEPGETRERSREDSEFLDLMGSLERHLDGNRRD